MKTRTSTLLAVSIAMMAFISVNASAQGPDYGRRGDGGRRGHSTERVEHRNGNFAKRPSSHSDNRSYTEHRGHNNGPAVHHNNRPAPDNHITPSVGHHPAPAHRHHEYADHRPDYRPAPRHHEHYRRPVAPRYYHRSAAYYRRAHIFADCLAAAAANALAGAIVANIPPYFSEILINGTLFYLADNILYRPVIISGRPYFEVASPYYY